MPFTLCRCGWKTAGVTVFPDYAGSSPCCARLDQTNFQLPHDMLRAFSDNDETLPLCASIKTDIQVEMALILQSLASPLHAQDSISIPVNVMPGELDCLK
jgi:hypothetical protein